MPDSLKQIKKDFTQGLSQISRFWGFPKGMGAIFAVLYLSPTPLSLDEIVQATGLTKGAISTEIRALARMGLVHRSSRLGDRRDYYEAESDFYAAIRSILLLAVAFGLQWAPEQIAAFMVALEAILAVLVRNKVSPV